MGTAIAQSAPRRSVTHHQGIFNGKKISYTATVNETFLSLNHQVSPGASIISTAYVVNNQGDRPVIFIFNGGPGASSSPLHMEALGPYRSITDPGNGTRNIAANPYSPLDMADLVFIDPVGTGFTRATDSATVKAHWDVEQDARAVADLIKAWKIENKRENSPVYICGQSYGTTRAAEILGVAPDLHLSGVLLLSVYIDPASVTYVPGNDIPYLIYLPTMAAVAAYHHKTNTGAKNVEEIYKAAEQFAENEYAPALMKGNAISEADKKRVAARLAALTGLTESYIIDKNLRVGLEDFELTLLAPDGKRLGQLDGRVSTTTKSTNRNSPYNDPSFGGAKKTKAKSLISRYFTDSLNFPDTSNYNSINFTANFNWKWPATNGISNYWTVAPFIADAMAKQPGLRLFVSGGYYDLATPLYAAQYTLGHIGIPANLVTWVQFATGHDVFDSEENLKVLTEKIREFLRPITDIMK